MNEKDMVVYSYQPQDPIKEMISKRNEDDLDALSYLIDKITLWKINRQVDYSQIDKINDYLKKVIKISSLDDLSNENIDVVRSTLNLLMDTKGIRLPIASTILNFFNPIFPICDQRAYRAAYKIGEGEFRDYPQKMEELRKKHVSRTDKPANYIDLYFDFCELCTKIIKNQLKDTHFILNDKEETVTQLNIDKYLYAVDEGPVKY